MRSYFKTFFWISFLLLTHCSGFEETAVVKELTAFHELELQSVFDVFLIQGDSYSIKIEGDDDVVDKVKFKVEAGILSVRNENKIRWVTPGSNKVTLYITVIDLQEIRPFEACSIKTMGLLTVDQLFIVMQPSVKLMDIDMDLDCNNFHFWNNHKSGGRLTLRGRADNLTLYTFFLTAVDAKDLISTYAVIENNSRGDCELRVTRKLDYSIRGEGDILLHGNPPEILEMEDISTGELIKVD
jgi:hypothetical protein